MVRQMVVAGLGVSVMPALALEAGDGPGAGIAVRRFPAPEPSRRIGLAWRSTTARDGALRNLAAAIRKRLPPGLEVLPALPRRRTSRSASAPVQPGKEFAEFFDKGPRRYRSRGGQPNSPYLLQFPNAGRG
jgi:LysR substrate binding domain